MDRPLTNPNALLSLDDARRRLHVTGQSDGGLQSIPLDRIIGTVDRSIDFALSHSLGREEIDAEVTRLQTSYEVTPDVDVLTLVHTEQQRIFLEESGLGRARPDAVIVFTRPQGYSELLDVLRSHFHELSRSASRLVPDEESAAGWYDNVYLPALKIIKATRLPQRYPFKTDADMYLWTHQLRRSLQPTQPDISWAEAAEKRASEHHGPFFRWRHQRYLRRPLQRR